jgi:hypothetical protein
MKPWLLVLHPMAIIHLMSYKRPLQLAIEDKDKKEVEVLLKAGIDPNQYESGSVSLDYSVASDAYECTVLLLKYGANPDLIVKNVDQQEKIIQPCIQRKDNSTLILLAMYGATSEGVQFPVGCEEQKALLLNTMQKKAECDRLLLQAVINEKNQPHNYQAILSSYQAAGDIWYQLSLVERNGSYQKHYQEKALELYELAAACYKKLATHPSEPAYFELFSRMADLYHAQGHKAKELESAKLAAQNAAVSNKAYQLPQLFPVSQPNDNFSAASLRQRKITANPEQQALLQASTSLRV